MGKTILYGNGINLLGGGPSWNKLLQDISKKSLYHVRAYARNAYGVGYSDDITFLTGGNLPDEDENKVPNL